MKKLALVLAFFIALSSVNTFANTTVQAQNVQATSWQNKLFNQLGMLESLNSMATVTKQDAKQTVDKIYNSDALSKVYFEGQNLNDNLLYGQWVMILVDMLGYTPVISPDGFSEDSVELYMNCAQRIGLLKNETLTVTDTVSQDVYSRLLYRAIAELPMMAFDSIDNGESVYKTDKDKTILSEQMNIFVISGVVTGAYDTMMSSDNGGGIKSVKIDNKLYNCDFDDDLFDYLGYRTEAYVDEKTNHIKALIIPDGENEVLMLQSDDISDASLYSITYDNGKREKVIKLASTVDVIFNRELLSAYDSADFLAADSNYTLIDNNIDGRYDVVIIEKFDTFIVKSKIASEYCLVDKQGNIHNFEDYLEEGNKIYFDGKEAEFISIIKDMIVSVLRDSKDNITSVVVSNKKVTGTYQELETANNKTYITIDDIQYECASQYINNINSYEKITLGDRVKAYFDMKGRIIDIISVTSITHAGYFMDYYEDGKGVSFRILDDDGEIKEVFAEKNPVVDGVKKSIKSALNTSTFMNGSELKKQLILYKISKDGKITWMDTADENSTIGSTGYYDLTMNYNYEKDGTLKVLSFNSKRILGSKYYIDADVVVFGVSDEDDECYVQNGTSLATSTDLKVNLYNVNDDYEPQYIVVREDSRVAKWVSGRYDAVMVDKVVQKVDDDGDHVYAVKYYTHDGYYRTSIISDGNLTPVNGNAFSGDSRLNGVKIKDLKPGSIIQFMEDAKGIYAYAVQFMPRKENDEIIFEKISTASGWDYGLDYANYNGDELHSYGKVLKIAPAGIIINNHLPTAEEIEQGLTYPVEKWNRYITFGSQQSVLFFDKKTETITVGSYSDILPDDMIYTKRKALTYNGIFVYR